MGHSMPTHPKPPGWVNISDFDENWLKCSSTYMMATCKKVLSSGDKFDFYSHIYTGGGGFPIFYSRCRN